VRYGVIGGGALGLTVAVRLAERGHEVTVLERDPVPGGLAGSFEVAPGIWLEKFYHHIFQTDRFAVRLIDELGLGASLRWHRPATTVFLDGRTYPLDSALAVLRFSALSLPNRLRLAAGVGYLRLLPSAGSLERRTTNLVDPAEYGGRHLVYLGNYRDHDDPIFSMSKDEVLASFEPGLRRLNVGFERSWIRESWSFAAPYAQPIVTPAFARTIPGLERLVRHLEA
jgi:protoporphyrinogen oxidase